MKPFLPLLFLALSVVGAPAADAPPAATPVPAGAGDTGKAAWLDNYDEALAEAKAGHKIVLMNFTGSDWCPWCIRLDREVFSQPAFQSYAAKNLVLLEVDFPQGKTLPPEVKKQNEDLAARYKVEGFPTVILLDAEGKQLGEPLGYMEGGAEAFIAAVEDQREKASSP